MKKRINVFILIIIILSIGIGIGYASAISIESKDVVYDNNGTTLSSTDVQGALDEVYTKSNGGNALAANLTSGKTAIVGGKLITGTGADNTSYYNLGVTNADARVSTSSASYTAGYNAGKSAGISGMNLLHHKAMSGRDTEGGIADSWYLTQDVKNAYKALVITYDGRGTGISLPCAGLASNILDTGGGQCWVNLAGASVGQGIWLTSYDYYDGITVVGIY